MKNLIVYYFLDQKILHKNASRKQLASREHNQQLVRNYIKFQIDISLLFNWNKKDILILSNEDIGYRGIKSIIFENRNFFEKPFIYKPLGLIYAFEKLKIKENIWYHDWDLFQIENLNYSFPENKDIGVYYGVYYNRIRRPNGGILFAKPSSVDFLKKLANRQINKETWSDDEHIITELVNENPDRVDKINDTYNIGMVARNHRVLKAEKPLKCMHFRPNKKWKIKRMLPFIIEQAKHNENTKKALQIFVNFMKQYKNLKNLNDEKIVQDLKEYL